MQELVQFGGPDLGGGAQNERRRSGRAAEVEWPLLAKKDNTTTSCFVLAAYSDH